jgi:hypothetical protein
VLHTVVLAQVLVRIYKLEGSLLRFDLYSELHPYTWILDHQSTHPDCHTSVNSRRLRHQISGGTCRQPLPLLRTELYAQTKAHFVGKGTVSDSTMK